MAALTSYTIKGVAWQGSRFLEQSEDELLPNVSKVPLTILQGPLLSPQKKRNFERGAFYNLLG